MSRFLTFPHGLSCFFSAYFIPKGWQPSLLLILLARNLIPGNAVIPPHSTTVQAGGIFHKGYFDECLCLQCLVILQSSSLAPHCKSQWTLQSGAPATALPGAEQAIGKKALSIPGAKQGRRHMSFLCAHSEWPGSLSAPRKRVAGRCELESEAPGHQGLCLPDT